MTLSEQVDIDRRIDRIIADLRESWRTPTGVVLFDRIDRQAAQIAALEKRLALAEAVCEAAKEYGEAWEAQDDAWLDVEIDVMSDALAAWREGRGK
jgi:predicted transcriptional regulator